MSVSGYIIEKYNNMSGAYTCNRLVSEAAGIGIDLMVLGIHDCYVESGDVINRGKQVQKRDFVINRYKWGKIKEALNHLGERSYNPLEAYDRYVNKYEQVSRLRSLEFLIPRYILGTSLLKYGELSSHLGSPFVAKGLESSQGTEIFLIKSMEDYENLKAGYGIEKEWLYEEFITTSVGRDIRLYSIRGNVEACMVRKSKGDFRANVALGGDVASYEITPEIRTIARDIYRQTGLDFIGIDLLFGESKPYFCEINVMPGIEGIEKASGINIGKRIMETIKGDFEVG
ncbi:30S ribosomal protein S6--L-glutamate ligase [Lachnospiraceae bacterium]|jgi:RimK family alpha-L-glutamate ligase|nr:30S ribosomal protein S6--L-glutamate ligase [Lachnospiraceae bacterium]